MPLPDLRRRASVRARASARTTARLFCDGCYFSSPFPFYPTQTPRPRPTPPLTQRVYLLRLPLHLCFLPPAPPPYLPFSCAHALSLSLPLSLHLHSYFAAAAGSALPPAPIPRHHRHLRRPILHIRPRLGPAAFNFLSCCRSSFHYVCVIVCALCMPAH